MIKENRENMTVKHLIFTPFQSFTCEKNIKGTFCWWTGFFLSL